MLIDELQLIGESIRGIPRIALDEASGLFPPSVYYKFFELMAKKYRPAVSVVLGVCGGGDSYHLCKGNPLGTVIGVDIARDHEPQMQYIEAKCPGFKFWLGDSISSAPQIHGEYGLVDFLFIDTSHDEGMLDKEWVAWIPYLRPGAICCFDDIFRPGMQESWDRLPTPKIRMDWLHDGTYPHGGGFGILIYNPSNMIPIENYELGCQVEKTPYIPTQKRDKMIRLAWKYRRFSREYKEKRIHYLMVSRALLRAAPKRQKKIIDVMTMEILCQ